LNKYLKCSVWRLALRYDIYIYVVRLYKVKEPFLLTCLEGVRRQSVNCTFVVYPVINSRFFENIKLFHYIQHFAFTRTVCYAHDFFYVADGVYP